MGERRETKAAILLLLNELPLASPPRTRPQSAAALACCSAAALAAAFHVFERPVQPLTRARGRMGHRREL